MKMERTCSQESLAKHSSRDQSLQKAITITLTPIRMPLLKMDGTELETFCEWKAICHISWTARRLVNASYMSNQQLTKDCIGAHQVQGAPNCASRA